MSIASSLVDILREEMAKCNAVRLVHVRVRYGAMTNIVPDALLLGFEVVSLEYGLEGATLELVEEPLLLACGGCGREFSPKPAPSALFAPCPFCAEETCHEVRAGKALYLDHMEVE